MKKRTPPKNNAPRSSRSAKKQAKSNFTWMITVALCFTTFICIWGLATAARNTPTTSALATEKNSTQQALLNQARTNQSSNPAVDNPPPTDPPTTQATDSHHEGISIPDQGPFSPAIFTYNNMWQGSINGMWLVAYSGAKKNSDGTTGQGGIMLFCDTGGVAYSNIGLFLAPIGTTSLTVLERNGSLLKLESKSGTRVLFDLLTHQFSQQ